jgi:hypothetical protein
MDAVVGEVVSCLSTWVVWTAVRMDDASIQSNNIVSRTTFDEVLAKMPEVRV